MKLDSILFTNNNGKFNVVAKYLVKDTLPRLIYGECATVPYEKRSLLPDTIVHWKSGILFQCESYPTILDLVKCPELGAPCRLNQQSTLREFARKYTDVQFKKLNSIACIITNCDNGNDIAKCFEIPEGSGIIELPLKEWLG